MQDIASASVATWNAEGAILDRLLDAHWSRDVRYTDPLADVTGREALAALVTAARAPFPGCVFALEGPVEEHHDVVRFRWGLGPEGAAPLVIGSDVVEVDDEGRIRRVLGFLDLVPST